MILSALLLLALFPIRPASATSLKVLASDGQGIMTVNPETVVYGTGNNFTFTFTAVNDIGTGAGGYAINLSIPPGWTAPVDAAGPGQITITNGNCSIEPSLGGINGDSLAGYVVAIDIKNCADGTFFTVLYENVKTGPVSGSQYTFVTATDFKGGDLAPLTAGSPQISVTPKPLTVTGGLAPGNKVYDCTTTSILTTGTPSLQGIVPSDIVALEGAETATGTFSNKHIGTGKIVTITGLSLSGADSSNYTIAPVTRTANITAKPITVTAVTDTRIYNGTTSSSGAVLLAPDLCVEDTSGFTQIFNNKHTGTNKTLTPTGIVNDGNSGLNYIYTFTANTTGSITPLPITVMAVTDTKVYDGNVSSDETPLTSPTPAGTDSPSFTQIFADANAGTLKDIIPSGVVNDGNAGGNYSYTFIVDNTGQIDPKPITVTADSKSKIYGAADPAFTFVAPAIVPGDTLSGALSRDSGDNVGSYEILQGTLSNSNYTINYVSSNLTINQATLTVRPHNHIIVSGTADPVFTFSYSGFVSPNQTAPVDTPAVIDTAPSCSSSGLHVDLKVYPIICDGGADNNYAFQYINGTLTVIARNTQESLGAFDGWALESSETSNLASTKNNSGVLRVGDDIRNKQYRSLLYFDTASLPNNAILTKVTIRIKKAGTTGTDPFTTHGNLVADMKKGFFGLAPLEIIDFNAAGAPISNAGNFNDAGSGWYQLTLSPTNFKYINLLGVTQFRLRFIKDDDNDKTTDLVSFFDGTDATNPPELIIEYTLP